MKLAKVHCTFANWQNSRSCIGESPGGVLAKVRCTFANWRNSRGRVGESTVDFRHWRKLYWRKSYWRNSEIPNPDRLHLCPYPSIIDIIPSNLQNIYHSSDAINFLSRNAGLRYIQSKVYHEYENCIWSSYLCIRNDISHSNFFLRLDFFFIFVFF